MSLRQHQCQGGPTQKPDHYNHDDDDDDFSSGNDDNDGYDSEFLVAGQDNLALFKKPAAATRQRRSRSLRLPDNRDPGQAETGVVDVLQRKLFVLKVGLLEAESLVWYTSEVGASDHLKRWNNPHLKNVDTLKTFKSAHEFLVSNIYFTHYFKDYFLAAIELATKYFSITPFIRLLLQE